eukprot:ANDGO_02406.mRNA.1 Methylsterol monooxygenase 2-2
MSTSVAESLWLKLQEHVSDFHISTTLTFVYILGVYVIASVPWWLFDFFGLFKRYKIQQLKSYNAADVKKCLKVLAFNHIVLALPLIYLSYPILVWRGVSFDLPLPDLFDIAIRVVIYFLLEDFWFYCGHRALHLPWAYKHIHSMHHQFNTPIGMASSYAHPVEFLFLGVGTFLGPVIIGGGHILSVWVWAFFRQWEAIEVHCGYDFPLNFSKICPLYCGPAHHDYHHFSYDGNYASTFVIWDWMFGTSTKYRRFCADGGHAAMIKRKQMPIQEQDVYDLATNTKKSS